MSFAKKVFSWRKSTWDEEVNEVPEVSLSSSWSAARKASVFPHDGSQNPGGFLAVPVLHRSCFVISVTFSIGCWDTGKKVSHKKGLFCFFFDKKKKQSWRCTATQITWRSAL